jgi:hypothetical protein
MRLEREYRDIDRGEWRERNLVAEKKAKKIWWGKKKKIKQKHISASGTSGSYLWNPRNAISGPANQ